MLVVGSVSFTPGQLSGRLLVDSSQIPLQVLFPLHVIRHVHGCAFHVYWSIEGGGGFFVSDDGSIG